MPRKKKDILITCEELERRYPNYVAKIKEAISTISSEELSEKRVRAVLATKLRECREYVGLTTTTVGALLGVSHAAILKYENAKKPMARIDVTYLEMFSLIYNVSPLYLVGKTDNTKDYTGDMPAKKLAASFNIFALIKEVSEFEMTKPALYASKLVTTLYSDGIKTSLENRELMQLFLRVCDAKDRQRNIIKRGLMGIPIIQKLTDEIEEVTEEQIRDEKTDDYRAAEASNREHMAECVLALSKLGEKDLKLLKCLYAISCKRQTKECLGAKILKEGGFFDEPTAFVKNTRSTKLQS